MKRRKTVCILILAVMLVTAACGNAGTQPSSGGLKSAAAETTAETPKTEDPIRVGVSIFRYEDAFMTSYRQELTKYLEETYRAAVTVEDAQGDQKIQDTQITQFLEEGCDVLILNLVQPDRASSVVDQCREKGVPVVFINREPEESEILRWKEEKIPASYVGSDSGQSGTYQGEIILDTPDQGDINGDGVVTYAVIQGEPDHTDTILRTEYSIKVLEDNGQKTSGVFVWPGYWEEEQGYELAAMALNNYGYSLEVIFCNNDAMANGASRAIEERGRKTGKDIYLVGVDALEDTVGLVKEGKITGTVLNDYTGQSHTAADVAVKMAGGGKAETKYLIDYVKITTISDYP